MPSQRFSSDLHQFADQIVAREGMAVSSAELVYDRLMRDRIIFLNGEVNDSSAKVIVAQLLYLAAEDPSRDIALYINSPGGSVYAGLAIYDTMQYVPCDVSTVALGLAASMGQFLLCGGTKGKRFATRYSSILMHQPLGGIGGTASDIKIQAELILHMKRTMAELTAQQSGQTVEQITKDADRDRWFTAPEALEYGLVDHVVQTAGQVTGGGGTTA
jgi:ATP-dependent Clp protease protease subunit